MIPSLVAALAAVLLLPGVGLVRERQPDRPVITVFRLKHAIAERAAKVLTAHLGKDRDVQITWDELNNIVFLQGSAETARQAKTILDRLDVRRDSYNFVFPLKHTSAARTATLMNAILTVIPFLDWDCRFHMRAEEGRNRVIVIGVTKEEARLLRKILSRIDEENGPQ
jgi:type II secretory pathway component GspD/PulD (secretin)